MSVNAGTTTTLQFDINETDTLAGTPFELVSPASGYITELSVTVQKAVTTGGAVTVNIGVTPVAGLSVTVADGAASGTRGTATATKGSATRAVKKGDRIQIVPAASFNGAGAVNGYINIQSVVLGEA